MHLQSLKLALVLQFLHVNFLFLFSLQKLTFVFRSPEASPSPSTSWKRNTIQNISPTGKGGLRGNTDDLISTFSAGRGDLLRS
jgi:hypothetical protein